VSSSCSTTSSARNRSLVESSLCVSRACLGKMIMFSKKWQGKRWDRVFLPVRTPSAWLRTTSDIARCNKWNISWSSTSCSAAALSFLIASCAPERASTSESRHVRGVRELKARRADELTVAHLAVHAVHLSQCLFRYLLRRMHIRDFVSQVQPEESIKTSFETRDNSNSRPWLRSNRAVSPLEYER
jgi:hypothetical protein